jgi:hypothetical protein
MEILTDIDVCIQICSFLDIKDCESFIVSNHKLYELWDYIPFWNSRLLIDYGIKNKNLRHTKSINSKDYYYDYMCRKKYLTVLSAMIKMEVIKRNDVVSCNWSISRAIITQGGIDFANTVHKIFNICRDDNRLYSFFHGYTSTNEFYDMLANSIFDKELISYDGNISDAFFGEDSDSDIDEEDENNVDFEKPWLNSPHFGINMSLISGLDRIPKSLYFEFMLKLYVYMDMWLIVDKYIPLLSNDVYRTRLFLLKHCLKRRAPINIIRKLFDLYTVTNHNIYDSTESNTIPMKPDHRLPNLLYIVQEIDKFTENMFRL